MAMGSYFIWTIGCQMNRADSRRAGNELERLGYRPAARPEDADLVVVNSCVVRQGAEDKVLGRLRSLGALKVRRPGTAVVLMGCLVGDVQELHARFPHVDLFVRPSDVGALVEWVAEHPPLPRRERAGVRVESLTGPTTCHSADPPLTLPSPPRGRRNTRQVDTPPLTLPSPPRGEGGRAPLATPPISAEVAAMMGCDRHCTYCLVRLRRGPGHSRPAADVVAEADSLVRSGAREIVLLGQNIDAYGRDLPGQPTLASLLEQVHAIPGLLRLRFLTSHPADLDDGVIEAVASLPRVCAHWELPVQAGDDRVLRRMGRGYTAASYLALVERIRSRLPGASIATDVIVGFPGETAEQFGRTLDLLRAARLDAVHVACYSERPGTPAARLADDVPPEEKERRRRAVEELQETILTEINAHLLGQEVAVLVEELHRGKWKGRTATNKLVFFEHPADWRGRLASVRIAKTGPWSLQGEVRNMAGYANPPSN